MKQELLGFSELVALGSSPDSVRSKFEKRFGKKPDGIALNRETYFNAVKPSICEQYSHYCYKQLGGYEFTESTSLPPQNAILGSSMAVNNGDSEAEVSLQVQGSWSEQQSWSASITTGMTYSEEIGIEGIFKTGMEFSVAITAGRSGSSSVTKSASYTVTVKVPPKSQVEVSIVATMKKERMAFKAPIKVSGMFGANFPKRVQDHYFWFLSADEVLEKTSGEINGYVEGTAAFDVHAHIGQAQPITPKMKQAIKEAATA